jgi:hypothetical protein
MDFYLRYGIGYGNAEDSLEGVPFLSIIRLLGRIFLSPERSKVCFELLEMNSAAQNLALAEG